MSSFAVHEIAIIVYNNSILIHIHKVPAVQLADVKTGKFVLYSPPCGERNPSLVSHSIVIHSQYDVLTMAEWYVAPRDESTDRHRIRILQYGST